MPIRVNLSQDETAQFAVHRHRFAGVDIKAQLLRHYPHDVKTTHVLGYVGRISQRDLEQIDVSNYAGTSHIGKNGVEKTYESALHGAVGLEQVEVNAAGRRVRTLEQAPPESGVDIHLHLDIALQEVAMKAFGDNNGAAVAINPKNGGILAFVSQPGYDPNLFVEGISTKNYDALQDDESRPLYNRALRGQYPPGSTVKPFMGLAGLERGRSSLTAPLTARVSSSCLATRIATATGRRPATAPWTSMPRSCNRAMSSSTSWPTNLA